MPNKSKLLSDAVFMSLKALFCIHSQIWNEMAVSNIDANIREWVKRK